MDTIKNARIFSTQWSQSAVNYNSRLNLTFTEPFSSSSRNIVRLELEPNHNLFADSSDQSKKEAYSQDNTEASHVEILDSLGNLVHSEDIKREQYKVFMGTVFLRHGTCDWVKVGNDARIIILEDGSKPVFEGSYSVHGNYHHIKTLSHYKRKRIAQDVDLDGEDSTLVVWRDYDDDVEMSKNFGEQGGSIITKRDVYSNYSICGTENAWPLPKVPSIDNFSHNTGLGFFSSFLSNNRGLFGVVKRSIDGSNSNPSLGTRQDLVNSIGSTQGCPNTRKVAYLGVAVDCSYTNSFSSQDDVKQAVISMVNQVSGVYEATFNVSIGLKNLVISESNCPSTPPVTALWNVQCTENNTLNSLLSSFSAWRGQRSNDSIAIWSLLSGCSVNANGAEIGVAWPGMLCVGNSITQGNQTISGTNVVGAYQNDWKIMAHEIGHGFGAVHDCTSQTCSQTDSNGQPYLCCSLSSSVCNANGQYLMNPSLSSIATTFSPCTQGEVCTLLGSGAVSLSCLVSNRDVILYSGSECGNGIVEQGEECDCGGVEGCAGNLCCDPTTCKYRSGAVCDDQTDMCCQSCQFASNRTICRESKDAICDPAEYCSGSSSGCPPNNFAANGVSCGSGSLACASGMCTSQDLQCQQAFNGSQGAYDSSSCLVACMAPTNGGTTYGRNVIFTTFQPYINGTKCGSGMCQGGRCIGGSPFDGMGSWFTRNKTTAIAIGVSIGGVILLAILYTCISRMIQRKQTRKQPVVGNNNGFQNYPMNTFHHGNHDMQPSYPPPLYPAYPPYNPNIHHDPFRQ